MPGRRVRAGPVRLDPDRRASSGAWSRPGAPDASRGGRDHRRLSNVAVFRATALIDARPRRRGRGHRDRKVSDVVFGGSRPSRRPAWRRGPAGRRPRRRDGARHGSSSTPRSATRSAPHTTSSSSGRSGLQETDRGPGPRQPDGSHGADGTFRRPDRPGGDRSYKIVAAYTDEGGRSVTDDGPGGGRGGAVRLTRARVAAVRRHPHETGEYSVGEDVRVRFMGGVAGTRRGELPLCRSPGGAPARDRGHHAHVPHHVHRRLRPAIGITGVRFNGLRLRRGDDSSGRALRQDDRRIGVTVTPDKARYAPGETATVTVRTTGPDGKPAPASV